MTTTLESERLLLRPFLRSDAPTIRALAGHPDVAKTTLNIPYPYPEGAAEAYIESLPQRTDSISFAVVRKQDQQLIGGITIHWEDRFRRAEIGYWIGVLYWNQGYASEAARRVVDYGFASLNLNRIYACYFPHNPASRRVMDKVGMTYEGTLRQHVERDGVFTDVGYCGILRREWEAQTPR